MRHFACVLSLFLLLAALAPARAATFSDSTHGFSIELPNDWAELSPGDVASAVQTFSPDPNLEAFTGFQYTDKSILAVSSAAYPNSANYSDVTLRQIKQIAAALTGAKPAEFHTNATPVVPNLGIGAVRQVTCFTTPPGFVIDYQEPKFDARSRSFAFIGRDRLITLHFFMRPADFPTLKPLIDPIALSFKFHSRQAVTYNPATKSPRDFTNWALYTLVALTLAGAAYIAYYLLKPKPF